MASFRLVDVESLSFVGSFTFQDEYFSPRAVDPTWSAGISFELEGDSYVAKILPDVNCPSYKHSQKVDFTHHMFVQVVCQAGCNMRLLAISDSVLGTDLKKKLDGAKTPISVQLPTTLRNLPTAMSAQASIHATLTPDRNCHYISEIAIRIPKDVLDLWFERYLNFRQQIGLKQ